MFASMRTAGRQVTAVQLILWLVTARAAQINAQAGRAELREANCAYKARRRG